MNAYELKQEKKRERRLERAEKLRAEGESKVNQANREMSMIPFGQPILVGHHSERPMRNMIQRNFNRTRTGYEMQERADKLELLAKNMGKAISSDDPEAVTKLKAKLLVEEQRHAEIKAREHQSYELSNSNGRLKSIKDRIACLERLNAREEKADIVTELYTIKENKEDNRIQVFFQGKPEEKIRDVLKSCGFRWSPMNGAWQVFLNGNGAWQVSKFQKLVQTV